MNYKNWQKGGNRMATTKAGQKAVNKYVKNNYDRINFTIKKGAKEKLAEVAATKSNGSINGYIKKAVEQQYKTDTGSDIDL